MLLSLKQLCQIHDPDIVSQNLSLMISYLVFLEWNMALFRYYGNLEPDGMYPT